MPDPLPERHIDRLRYWRNRRDTHRALGDIASDFFEKQIARPHRQVGRLVDLWETHCPPDLARQCRLASFTRGILTVEVASAAMHYQLDRHLRSGIERTMRREFAGNLRKIRIKVARIDRPT